MNTEPRFFGSFAYLGEPWMESAPCRGSDSALFFVDDTTNPISRRRRGPDYELARKICETCPHTGLSGACLEWALRTGTLAFGLFGGFSPTERQVIARRRREQDREASLSPLRPSQEPRKPQPGTPVAQGAFRRPIRDPRGLRALRQVAR